MANEFELLLLELSEILRKGNNHYADLVTENINGGNSKFEEFLVSNELWGGAGSIADQALIENKTLRNEVEKLLIKLGKVQIAKNVVNVRTEFWVNAFEDWHSIQNSLPTTEL